MFISSNSNMRKNSLRKSAITTYQHYRVTALFRVFIGYLSYYIFRNNFILSTPYLKSHLNLTTTHIWATEQLHTYRLWLQ